MVRLSGSEPAKNIKNQLLELCETLPAVTVDGVETKAVLAILTAGVTSDSEAYIRGIMKSSQTLPVYVKRVDLPGDVTEAEFIRAFDSLNEDPLVDGIIIMQPLPKQIRFEQVKNRFQPRKDVDAVSTYAQGGIFLDDPEVYPPCTAESVVEILKYYNVPISGKQAVVLGRSFVIGKPVSMLLLKENATVTICHSRTQDLKAVTKQADILVCAMGKAEFVDSSFVKEGAVVMDVGINFKDGRMVGDANYDDVSTVAGMVTPVPGGVGSVTTALLLRHTVLSAVKKLQKNI